jgi:hypothetical protein
VNLAGAKIIKQDTHLIVSNAETNKNTNGELKQIG